MKIPENVKIGGLIYEIIQSQDVANEGSVFGSKHSRQQKIFLETSEKQQKKEQTFFHEILHAIWEESGLCSRYEKDQPKLEEEIVEALSNGLYQVLIDNNLLR